MIKGCQRRIIMVKDTDSRYFDSAYFVLRNDIDPRTNDRDIMCEANRMISSYAPEHTVPGSLPGSKPQGARYLISIALLSIGLISALAALFVLLF